MKTRTFTITGMPKAQYEWLAKKAEEAGVSISSYIKMFFTKEIEKEARK